MNKSGATFPLVAFPLLYIAISPWRHPYFNKPLCVFLVVALMVLVIWWMRARLRTWATIAIVTLASYVISIGASLFTWATESATGLAKILGSSESNIVLGTIFGFPVFSYSAPIVLLVLIINKYLVAPRLRPA